MDRAVFQRYLRFILSLAWLPLVAINDSLLFPLLLSSPGAVKLAGLVKFASFALVFLAVLLSRDRMAAAVGRRRTVVVATLLLLLGALLGGFSGMGILPIGFILAGSGLKGVGAAVLLLCWLDRFSSPYLRPIGSLLAGAVVFIGTVSIALVGASVLAPTLPVVVLGLLPLLAPVLPDKSGSLEPDAAVRVPSRRPWAIFGATLVSGAAFSLLLTLGVEHPVGTDLLSVQSLIQIVLAGTGIFLGVGYLCSLRKIGPVSIGASVALLATWLIVVFVGVGTFYLLAGCIAMGWAGTFVALMIICAGVSPRFGVSALELGAETALVSATGTIVGMLVLPAAGSVELLGQWLLPTVLLVSATPVVFPTLFLPDERRRLSLWGMGSVFTERSAVRSLEQRCAAIGAVHHLTPRETEILVLLAKGRNRDYISKEFVLSGHTVKTHIHHIYEKLGVHTHQDLINLVESGADPKSRPAEHTDSCAGPGLHRRKGQKTTEEPRNR